MTRLWRRFNSSIVTSTLISVGVRIAAVIALMTTASYYHIYSQVEGSKLAEMQVFTQERGARESQIFKLAEDNHQLLKRAIHSQYPVDNPKYWLDKFEQNFAQQADGAIRNNRSTFNASQTAGIWIASDVVLSEDIKIRAALFTDLVSQFGQSWHNRFINTYALGPENFAINYWPEIPDFVYRIDADFDIRSEEYFAISTPKANPSRETVWTGVYRDQQADLWMVSAETPIYLDDVHIATVGNDIALDELFARTIANDPHGSYDMIFRKDGRLIAHPNYVDDLKQYAGNFLIEQNGDTTLKAIFNAVNQSNTNQQLIELDQQKLYLMVSKIQGPDWFYVRAVPKSIITEVASSTAAIVFLFGLAALLFELLVLCMVMKKKITWPLLQLTRGSLAIARGHAVKQIDGVRSDELGRLARTFITMSERLKKRDQQLELSATLLQQQVDQLQVSEQRLAHAQEVAQLGSWEYSTDTQQLTLSIELQKLLHITEQEAQSMGIKSLLKLINPEGDAQLHLLVKGFLNEGISFRYSHAIRDCHGNQRFVHSTGEVCRDEYGAIVRFQGTVQDLSKQVHAEQSMRESEARFRNAFHNSPISMAIVSLQGKIIQANETLCRTFGYSQKEIQQMLFENLVHPDERHLSNEKLQAIVDGKATAHEVERKLICKDGNAIWCSINVFVQKDGDGRPNYIFVQGMDVTKRKLAESKLNHLAFHDPLTGLVNRTMFIEFLNKAIQNYKREPKNNFAVLFLDLDGFKFVNDSLGHLAGDKLLVAIAQRLIKETRASDTLARFGGDEFCILLQDVDSREVAVDLAKRINQALQHPFNLESEVVKSSTSIGIVLASSKLSNAQDYLRDADSAMYHAKHHGNGHYAIFDASMHRHAQQQLRLRNEINTALEHQQFEPFFQPIINTETGAISSFESLVRWQHPKRGLLAPFQFLEVAEEIKRINEIDIVILDSALAQLSQWHKRLAAPNLCVSCNCSSELLSDPEVIDIIKTLLAKHEIPARCLNLEITESVLVNDPETTMAILYQLQDLGVNIHLDDFGTGYSSLSYLHRFPIHNLKIDRSFISRILNSEKDKAIVESIILLANRLGISVTAEGVETPEQLLALKQIGVNRTQGYYHGKPMDAQKVKQMLQTSASHSA